MARRVCTLLFTFTILSETAVAGAAQLLPEVTKKKESPPAVQSAHIVVQTSANAEVYVDDQFKGRTSSEGRLEIGNAKAGGHVVRISASGKQSYEQTVDLIAEQITTVFAQLVDLPQIPGGETIGGAIARTHGELVALAHKGDRDYFEFTLPNKKAQQKIGTMTVELEKTDPKRNLFSVYLYFDDKKTERSNKAINEPVFFLVQGASSALELVVNKLSKDSISGYISTPKGFFPGGSPVRPY